MAHNENDKGRVIIFDDHSLFSYTIDIALSQHGLEVEKFDVGPETTADDILSAAKEFNPDVVVLDLHLGAAIENARFLIPELSTETTDVIVVTGDRNEFQIAGCISEGAACVLGKEISFEVFVSTILRVLHKEPVVPLARREELKRIWQAYQSSKRTALEPFTHLTPREQEVLAALVAGKSADAIADELYMSVSTVRSHIHSILNRLQVKSQLEAVAKALHSDWSPARS